MSRTSKVSAHTDAWVDEAFPSKHHASTTRIKVCGLTSNRRRGFLFFGRPFPLGCSVISAILQVNLHDGWGGGHPVDIQRVTDRWGESKINWNNQPGVGGTTITHTISGGNNDEEEIDVTAIYEAVTTGATYHGLRFVSGESGKRAFYASEHPIAAFRPKLIVVWAHAPEPPDNGAPAGDSATSLAKPTFDYHFGVKGTRADQRISAHRVQIAATSDFTTPQFDSAKVATDTTMLDLSDFAYALLDNSDHWWRVMAWDDDDIASDWSDKWQFQRASKGTLTLNSPTTVVNDLTPPITWVFTGRTQKKFEVSLFKKRDNGTWKRLWHMPKHTSSDTSINVPKNNIKTGETFMVRLRVWDNIDRQATPGDVSYVEVTKQFTYFRDGTPAGVTSLTADNFGGGVALSWVDPVEPDYYSLRVDGVEVDSRIEPVDVLTSTLHHYAMTFWQGRDGDELTFEIERVINSAGHLFHSGTNPQQTVTVIVEGKWLVDDDPTDALAIQIINAEQAGFDIGETGETFFPLASQRPVRITDAQRGFEGSVAGVLRSTDVAQHFLDLKGRQKVLRYAAQELNIPVRLGESSLSPKADAHNYDLWVVSFDLFQVDEFSDVQGLDVS